MQQKEVMPTDMKVLMTHLYEYKKGVRRMVLFTFNDCKVRTSVISFSLWAMVD